MALTAATFVRMPWLPHNLVLLAGGALAVVYYWLHCAGPSLYYSGATPNTMRFVRWLGVFTVAVLALVTAWNVVEGQAPAPVLVVMVAAGCLYFAAWPLPRVVGRIFGGVDAIEGRRRFDVLKRAEARAIAARDISQR